MKEGLYCTTMARKDYNMQPNWQCQKVVAALNKERLESDL